MASNRFNVIYEPKTGDIEVDIGYVNPTDAGKYECTAENVYGKDDTPTIMFIVEVPNIDYSPETKNPEKFNEIDKPAKLQKEPSLLDLNMRPPIILIPLSDQKLNEGKPLIFLSKIDGYPKPKVKLIVFNNFKIVDLIINF